MLHKAISVDAALPGVQTVEIVSDQHFPRHAHDQYGIGVMVEGAHRSWSGRGQVEAGPNHVITVSPGEMHDGRPVGGAPRRWRMLFVDPDVVAQLAGVERAAREFAQPCVDDLGLSARVGDVLRMLARAGADEAAGGIVDLFGALMDGPVEVRRGSGPSHCMRMMLDRIHDDPIAAPTLSELSEIAALSPYTLLRRFRRELGTTPHAYVLQYRVRRAHRAISAGASLTQAALDAGFSDQSHMTRAFVRQLGLTPGRCRP